MRLDGPVPLGRSGQLADSTFGMHWTRVNFVGMLGGHQKEVLS